MRSQDRWLIWGVSDEAPSSSQRLPPLEDEDEDESGQEEMDDGTASLDEGAVPARG